MGLPAFTTAGEPVGVVVLQMPDADDTGGGFNPLAMLGSMSQLQESMAGVVLPAEAVMRATQQAREAAGQSDEDD